MSPESVFWTIAEAAAEIYPRKSPEARAKTLKRQIITRQRRIADGRYPSDRISPETLARLRSDGTILHGRPGRGGVFRVNVGELQQILPELFSVQWHRAAAELREYIDRTDERIEAVSDDLGATAEASWCLYSELRDDITALRKLIDRLPSWIFRDAGGHRRTPEPGSAPEGERDSFLRDQQFTKPRNGELKQ